MAVLDEMVVVAPDATTAEVTIDDVKSAIARQFWGWYYARGNDVVLVRRRLLVWSVVIRVSETQVSRLKVGH